jgi:signal transduction histidine kinase
VQDERRAASDARTAFLANVSHELRTPLTAILGFADVLASGLDGPLSAGQARDVATIQASSRHLLGLIDELIDVASIESGGLDLSIRPVALEPVVRDAVEAIRPLAGAKGLRLEVVDRPGPPRGPATSGSVATPSVVVAADPVRLRGILVNLLSNAVKFAGQGGSVRVVIDVELGPRPVATVAVSDTGPGIPVEDQERIFETFVRIAGPETPGTGLGLSLARELARLHGGDLAVESTVGLGSTFTVRIPLATA